MKQKCVIELGQASLECELAAFTNRVGLLEDGTTTQQILRNGAQISYMQANDMQDMIAIASQCVPH